MGSVSRRKDCVTHRGRRGDRHSRKPRSRSRERSESGSHASALDAVDRAEIQRLLSDLLQLDASMANQLLQIFERLDTGNTVSIQDLATNQIRKKLRHLLTAFGIPLTRTKQDNASETFSKVYKAPSDFLGLLRPECRRLLKRVAEAHGISWKHLRRMKPAASNTAERSFVPEVDGGLVKDETGRPLSLMELRQKGYFDAAASRPQSFHRPDHMEPWGKPQVEQVVARQALQESSAGEPWRRFDRDRDLLQSSQVTKQQFQQCFNDPLTNLTARFRAASRAKPPTE